VARHFQLPVSQYPGTENAIVTVSTTYYGADAETVAGFITQPLEAAISQPKASITCRRQQRGCLGDYRDLAPELRLQPRPDRDQHEGRSVRNQLPPQRSTPVLSVAVGQRVRDVHRLLQRYPAEATDGDYLIRVVNPSSTRSKACQMRSAGSRLYALRAWLDPERMARMALRPATSPTHCPPTLICGRRQHEGQMVTVDLTASTDCTQLRIQKARRAQQDGAIIRLESVPPSCTREDYDFSVAFTGKRSVFIGIKVARARTSPGRATSQGALPGIQAQMPSHGQRCLRRTKFIKYLIKEVIKTWLRH